MLNSFNKKLRKFKWSRRKSIYQVQRGRVGQLIWEAMKILRIWGKGLKGEAKVEKLW